MNNNDKMDFLKATIKKLGHTNIGSISAATKLAAIGLDSLDIVELQMEYEDTFKKEIPETADPIITVGDILKLMK